MKIRDFFELEKKDRIIFILLCSANGNFLIGIIKLLFSLTIPSMWFFINAGFSLVLAICRFLTIKRYRIIRTLSDENEILKEEIKNYRQNGIMLILLRNNVFFC